MLRRRFLLLATCLLAVTGCREKSGRAPVLRVGMELTYPPFEMQDKAGNPDGVGVRLAEALAKKLGRPLKIVPMDFSGLIPALKTDNIDLIISSLTATDDRRQSIDFSHLIGTVHALTRRQQPKAKPPRVLSPAFQHNRATLKE